MPLKKENNGKTKLPASPKKSEPAAPLISKKELLERWMTAKEAMAFLNLQKGAFYDRIRAGLRHSKWGSKMYIDVQDLHGALLENKTQYKKGDDVEGLE